MEHTLSTKTQSLSAFKFGELHAPLFIGFCSFIYRNAREQKLPRIHFMTREGEFFKAVFDQLQDSLPTSHTRIESELLEASRLSTFGVTCSDWDLNRLQRLWNLYRKQTPAGFLYSLNIEDELLLNHFNRRGMTATQLINEPGKDNRFLQTINEDDFKTRAITILDRQKEIVRNYFSEKFQGQVRIGLVDIGWQGTIQDNLALLFPDHKFSGFYMGLSAFKNRTPENSLKAAMGPNRNESSRWKHLLDAVNVLEFVCLSLNGSVYGYVTEDEKSIAVRKADEKEDRYLAEFSIPFQQGVLNAVSKFDFSELASGLDADSIIQQAMNSWEDILREPCDSLVTSYFALRSNELFGLGVKNNQAVVPSMSSIFMAPFSSRRRSELIQFFTYSQWSQGMLKRKDLPQITKAMLFVLMRIALIAKKHKQKSLLTKHR